MVNQSKYIEYMLIKFNMADFKAAPFPFLSGIILEEGKSTPPRIPIWSSSKTKASIALSSTEAEYKGVVNACIQAVFLQGILFEFEIGSALSIVIFFDNQSDIKISMDLVQW